MTDEVTSVFRAQYCAQSVTFVFLCNEKAHAFPVLVRDIEMYRFFFDFNGTSRRFLGKNFLCLALTCASPDARSSHF